MARVSALTGKARSEESEGKPIAGMCWLWSMERFCGCPSLFIQRTEGLSFPTRNQLHFTISVLICIQLLAPDSSLQPFSQDTPSYVSPAPVKIFVRPAQENSVGWQLWRCGLPWTFCHPAAPGRLYPAGSDMGPALGWPRLEQTRVGRPRRTEKRTIGRLLQLFIAVTLWKLNPYLFSRFVT